MQKGDTKTIKKEAVAELAMEILKLLQSQASVGATVLALHGDLGAGKTTFVQALGRHLGIAEHITSPTFTIMKGYETVSSSFENLIHMDAYRIDDNAELRPLRFLEILAAPKTLFCIEWAEKIADSLPSDILNLTLTVVDENTRTAHLS